MDLLFSFLVLFIAIPICIGWLSMAPWVPTKKSDIERLVSLLNLKKWQNFLEIWCGDGRVSHKVAQKFPQANIMGIEIALPIFLLAKLRGLFMPQKNCQIQLANAFKKDFWKYDVIYVFGMPDKMWNKIVPKFLEETKPGTKLYSYVFSIPDEFKHMVKSHWGDSEAKIHILEKK